MVLAYFFNGKPDPTWVKLVILVAAYMYGLNDIVRQVVSTEATTDMTGLTKPQLALFCYATGMAVCLQNHSQD